MSTEEKTIPSADTLNFLRTTFAAELGSAREVAGNVPAVILRHGERIEKLDHLLHLRQRFTGSFHTESIPALARYVGQFIKPGDALAPVFVDVETMSAKAILNCGDIAAPGHCDHTASVKLTRTAFYTALLSITGNKKSQKELAEFLEDWNQFFLAPARAVNDGPVELATPANPYPDYTHAALPKSIQAIRSIQINKASQINSDVRDLGGTKSSFESIDATSTHTIPAMLIARFQPFEDLPLHHLPLRLSIITGEDPKLILRIVAPEAFKQKLGDQFSDAIDSALNGVALPIKGEFTLR